MQLGKINASLEKQQYINFPVHSALNAFMNDIAKYTILVLSIAVAAYAGSEIVPPVSAFDLPSALRENMDIKSYYFQGVCVSLIGLLVCSGLKMSSHSVFLISTLLALAAFALQCFRVQELELWFVSSAVLPFLIAVSSSTYLVGYVRQLTSRAS